MVCGRLATPYILLCYNSAMKYVGKKQIGFTIVELLVVIVVIGILATITIVSYSSITNNAKKQATASDAMTVASALNKYKADKGVYPPDIDTLKSAGYLNAGTQSTFQYRYTAATNSFCVTASVNGASSFVQSGTTAAKQGGCPGDGVNGQAPITNLATNPSAEAGTSGVMGYWSSPVGRTTGGAVSGSYIFTTTTNSTANGQGLIHTITTSAKPNQAYSCSLSLRSTPNATVNVSGRPATASDGYISEGLGGKNVALTSSWQTVVLSFTTPANTGILRIQYRLTSALSGITLQSDAIMCTEGSTNYTFADGDSPNWLWNGAQDASSSTGPAL